MATRAALVVLALTSSACSWIFQDRLRGGLEGYDARSEPHCSTSAGWQIVDGVFGGLSLVGALGAGSDATLTESQRNQLIASGVIWTLVHTASAISGATWAGQCKQAYAQWNDSAEGVSEDEERERVRLAEQFAENPMNDPAATRRYWCSSKSRRCVSDERTCAGSCTPRRRVWCASDGRRFLCAIDREACLVQRDRSRAVLGECVAQRARRGGGDGGGGDEGDRGGDEGDGGGDGDGDGDGDGAKAEVEREDAAESERVDKTDSEPEDKTKADGEPVPAVEPAPRGWYCMASPRNRRVGTCARDKATCELGRDAVVGAVPDVTACTLVETAHCFETKGRARCAPTAAACAAQRDRSGDRGAACLARP